MRLMLSLILSCFFFVAPFSSSAGNMPASEAVKKGSQQSKEVLLKKTADTDCSAIITPSVHSSNYSNRHSFFSFADYVNAVCCTIYSTALPGNKYFSHPYLYCKPIQLKLLFPKHYFW
jgi:hypothetical protein